jgi:hypothetical protein
VRQRRRRSQALAQEAFAIVVATGDNLLSQALIQIMKGASLELAKLVKAGAAL